MPPTKTMYYFQVNVPNEAYAGIKEGSLLSDKKSEWVTKGTLKPTYFEAITEAKANGEYPYRIKKEFVSI